MLPIVKLSVELTHCSVVTALKEHKSESLLHVNPSHLAQALEHLSHFVNGRISVKISDEDGTLGIHRLVITLLSTTTTAVAVVSISVAIAMFPVSVAISIAAAPVSVAALTVAMPVAVIAT